MILKRSDILSRTDLPTRTVHVPEWGGDVIVRTLTAGERDDWETEVTEAQKKGESANYVARFLVRVIVDENGKRIFTDDEFEILAAMSAGPLMRIFYPAKALSSAGQDDVEELEKKIKGFTDPAIHGPAGRDAGQVDRGDRTLVGAGAGGMDGVPPGPPA